MYRNVVGVCQEKAVETSQNPKVDYPLSLQWGVLQRFGLNEGKYTTIVVQKVHLLLSDMNIHLTKKQGIHILTQRVHPSN